MEIFSQAPLSIYNLFTFLTKFSRWKQLYTFRKTKTKFLFFLWKEKLVSSIFSNFLPKLNNLYDNKSKVFVFVCPFVLVNTAILQRVTYFTILWSDSFNTACSIFTAVQRKLSMLYHMSQPPCLCSPIYPLHHPAFINDLFIYLHLVRLIPDR